MKQIAILFLLLSFSVNQLHLVEIILNFNTKSSIKIENNSDENLPENEKEESAKEIECFLTATNNKQTIC